MKFFMEKNKDAGHRVTINIPKTTINNAVIQEFLDIRKKTNINGFRKGKAPIKIIQKKYGNTVYYDVFKELMQKIFYEFLNKEKIKIIGVPKYYMHQNQDNKKEYFEYSVLYEEYPNFNIKDIKNIKIKKILVNITNQDIKNILKKNQIKNNTWKKVNSSIKSNDRVTINYSIYEKNKPIKEFSSKKIDFIVSKNTLIPELNYKIINRYINDIFFFKIKFHKFHPEEALQEKDIVFKIKIQKIERIEEQELEINTQKEDQDQELSQFYYRNIKDNLNIQISNITQKYLEDQIAEKIVQKNIISIPAIVFQEEIKILYEKYKKQYQNNNDNILEKKYHVNIFLLAKKRLNIKIIIDKIINDNKLFIDEKDIQSLLKKISENYKKPQEFINLHKNNEIFKQTIKKIELEKKAMILLQKSMQVIKKDWTLDQFINYNWKNHEELII